ncbi:DUF3331 domain-containing protein [Paraburkholderia fungorum]|jgi:hypothetical protein|uniref:DUF3331 domain-containing protein n=1 Tax=Paraburkholderia fungorum TaxID=134537 RepID=UPI000DB42663|nr:MAG: hypothetical protein DI523_06660 [Paraburkholderia fungorum]QLD51922.1 hypothetical protein C9419_23415 [Paraburkholderia fungorum]
MRWCRFDDAVERLVAQYGGQHVMVTRRQQRRIWSGILDLLRSKTPTDHPSVLSQGLLRRTAPTRDAERRSGVHPHNRNQLVVVLDRPDQNAITVSWRDPQGCCYAEQMWRLRHAPHKGTCVLSGRAIAAGTPVFMPFSRPRPANAGEMILPAALSREDAALSDPTRPTFAMRGGDT